MKTALASTYAQLLSKPYGALIVKFSKYIAGSLLASVLSELTFLIVFGLTGHPLWATVLGWFAGAIPNYFLNRNWTWGRRDRPDFVREILPYVGIILVTLVVATITTDYANAHVANLTNTHWLQVLIVGAAYMLTYGVMGVLRFLLLERLFAPPAVTTREPIRVAD